MDTRRITLAAITLALAALMATCASENQDAQLAQGAALQDTEWVLDSLNGATLIGVNEITLNFGEASLEGSGGCNTYGGSYTASEDRLSFAGVFWTEMACLEPKGIMEQEQAYFQALNAVASYRVSGQRLELYDEAGAQILVFVSAGGPSPEQAVSTDVTPGREPPTISQATLEPPTGAA